MAVPLGAGAAAIAGQVEITIAEVENIARTTMTAMESDARTSTQAFRDLSIPMGAYGGVPMAQQFGAQHEAAHAVFMQTITGVLEDLRTFQANLLASARAHQSNDEAVESTFAAMEARYQGHTYTADTSYSEARHDDRLDVPAARDDGAGGAEGAAADGPEPSPETDSGTDSTSDRLSG